MGVYKLRTYIDNEHLIQKHQLPNASHNRNKIVYDALGNLHRYLKPPHRAMVYDFQYQLQQVQRDVQALTSLGYEVVVFLDQAIPEDKSAAWYSRRRDDVAIMQALMSSLHYAPPKRLKHWLPPACCTVALGEAFQAAGCDVHYSVDDNDREAAEYAALHNVVAVMTCDTDFLVYPNASWEWWDCESLNTRGNGVVEVGRLDHAALLASLGLSQDQLPLLAAVLGTDHLRHIPKDRQLKLLERFPQCKDVVLAAAQLVRYHADDLAPYRVQVAVQQYSLPRIQPPTSQPHGTTLSRTLAGIPRCTPSRAPLPSAAAVVAQELMDYQTYRRSVVLEDCTGDGLPIHLALRPLRLRVYRTLGVTQVRESLCIPGGTPSEWAAGEMVVVDPAGVLLLDPQTIPRTPALATTYIVGLLHQHGLLNGQHREALLLQSRQRGSLQKILRQCSAWDGKRPTFGSPQDLTVASLFLEAHMLLQVLLAGACILGMVPVGCVLPGVEAMLHVEIFHGLCQGLLASQ